MKTRLVIIIAAMAVMATGCRRVLNQFSDLITYPTTAEEVADMAKDYHSDAALVVTKADTQYVLYRRKGGESCFAMRYVSQHRCRHDFSARGGEFSLNEPERTVVLTRNGDNALSLTIDSLTIIVTNISRTDSAMTFRFGFDTANGPVRFDRAATLYLYGKARGSKEPLEETSLQQMLVLALGMDAMIEETDEEVAETYEVLEEAESDLEAAEHDLEQAAQAQAFGERYAEYSRLDSLACALGFANKESKADNDHLVFKAWGGLGGSKKCYARMERMSEEAATCHTAGYSVHHKPNHRGCTFTVSW